MNKPQLNYPTMRESILALCKMSWPECDIIFTPTEQISSLGATGQWYMWDYEGLINIAPLHRTTLLNAADNPIFFFSREETINIDSFDGITGVLPFVANKPFHVSIEIPCMDIHEEKCAVFSGGECNCGDYGEDCNDEDEETEDNEGDVV
jgi:hypothetical protein